MSELTDTLLESIKKLNLKLLNDAVEKGDKFIPKFHILGEGQDYVIFAPFKNEEEKIQMLSEVGAFAFEKKSHQIVFICDSYLKTYDNKKDIDYAVENWDTERPSLYPEDKRKEALIIYALDFKDASKESMITLLYKVVDKQLILEDTNTTPLHSFSGLIKNTLATSFAKEKLVDILKRREILPESFAKWEDKEVSEFMAEVGKEFAEEYPNILPSLR